jgi:hypothetical protein
MGAVVMNGAVVGAAPAAAGTVVTKAPSSRPGLVAGIPSAVKRSPTAAIEANLDNAALHQAGPAHRDAIANR